MSRVQYPAGANLLGHARVTSDHATKVLGQKPVPTLPTMRLLCAYAYYTIPQPYEWGGGGGM